MLDTKNLGTVTVDLQTVGRAFSLAVKTENETRAKRFGDALGRLTDRLETLRYRVNSAEAGVAPRGAAAVPRPPTPQPARRPSRTTAARLRRERARMNNNSAYYHAAPQRAGSPGRGRAALRSDRARAAGDHRDRPRA